MVVFKGKKEVLAPANNNPDAALWGTTNICSEHHGSTVSLHIILIGYRYLFVYTGDFGILP
jgi:hypothetical protein